MYENQAFTWAMKGICFLVSSVITVMTVCCKRYREKKPAKRDKSFRECILEQRCSMNGNKVV